MDGVLFGVSLIFVAFLVRAFESPMMGFFFVLIGFALALDRIFHDELGFGLVLALGLGLGVFGFVFRSRMSFRKDRDLDANDVIGGLILLAGFGFISLYFGGELLWDRPWSP